MLFRGTGTALVTPFTDDDQIDTSAMRQLIDRQIAGGIDALIILGTTGENATISPRERTEIVHLAVDQVDGRVPVILGTGNNSTSESIDFSREAASAGADALLIVGPYYNKPTQEGFLRHVAAIADSADLPIIIYNVPGRTCFNFTAQTTLRIAREIPSVVGVKEASGDINQITDILANRPDGFAVYAGDDELALPIVALGGDGVVSVIANALPVLFGQLIRAALSGDFAAARKIHFDLVPAMRACFAETNPIPVKAVLAHHGFISPRLRLPLIELADEHKDEVLSTFGQLKS